jgi:hypothetical protein
MSVELRGYLSGMVKPTLYAAEVPPLKGSFNIYAAEVSISMHHEIQEQDLMNEDELQLHRY